MKERTVLASALLTVLLLSLGLAGLSQAQEPDGPEGEGSPPDAPSAALGTSFTYQGRLTDGGSPANGAYDFEFQLYNAASAGGQVGGTVSLRNIAVSNGLFSVNLDFGDVFHGAALWLQVGVRPVSSSGAYTPLSPRQELTAAPYALGLRPGARILGNIGGDGALYASNASAVDYSSGLYGKASSTAYSVSYGVYGESASIYGRGVYGHASATDGYTYGVYGQSDSTSGMGLLGHAIAGSGLTYGVWGQSNSTTGTGLFGLVIATSGENYGVYGWSKSSDGTGVYGKASSTANFITYGVYGESASKYGMGVFGHAIATSGWNYGVRGESNSSEGRGVLGYVSATNGYTYGVIGESASVDGRGLYGLASATSGENYGVYGWSKSSAGTGVYGKASATSGWNYGVYGQSDSTAGTGVSGVASALSGDTFGVYGVTNSTDGKGVVGAAFTDSGEAYGVFGKSESTDGAGVWGYASATNGHTYGVVGESESASGTGVKGLARDTTSGTGVYGESWSTYGTGVSGFASATSGRNYGVYGWSYSPQGYGGYFVGDVYVSGDLSASGSKAFKIDHPLDPANQYLYHYSIESSEVLDQYSGNVTLDESGEAWVELPEWFPAINTDFRYQLTCIGKFAPVYIAQEIEGGRFKVAGGEPGMKISWTVTALRNDPYMQQYPQPVEQRKPDDELGTYLYPELYGQPQEAGLDFQRNPELNAPEPPGSE